MWESEVKHIVIAATGEVLGRIDLWYGTAFTVWGNDCVISFRIRDDAPASVEEYEMFWALPVYHAHVCGGL